ncbi:MAG TPA: hypothetical protein VNU01_02785 [Egibacteraceae bacterium]|nr:hypothetical protein [Egibacteraceae bacterium]
MSVVEERLRAAGAALADAPVPDVSGRVMERLESGRSRRGPALPRTLAAAAAALVLLAGTVLVFPSAGAALADLLGLPGLRIVFERRMPPVHGGLALGEAVSLAEARAATAFPLAFPKALGRPDEVWLDRHAVPGGQVTLLWRPGPGLPASGPHRLGALVTVLPGRLDAGALAKSLWQEDTELTAVRVGGQEGWWVSGADHALVYFDAEGGVRADRSRLAGPTLLWQDGEVLYRLESGLSLARALEVAASVR